MANGYSIRVAKAINSANDKLLGVRLGKICLAGDISVVEVAEYLGVTRPTVYSWFYGETDPVDPAVRQRVRDYMEALVDR